MKRELPTTPEEWFGEIADAMLDAAGEPLDRLLREPERAVNLFHLAPVTCLKFRGLDFRDEELREKVTEGALATYVANSSPDGIDHGLETKQLLAFAVCYVAAHFVLDLVSEEQASAALDFCEGRLN